MLIVAWLCILPGCHGAARDCVPAELAAARDWRDVESPDTYQPVDPRIATRLADALRRPATASDPRPPLNVLALSGGGMFGAFGVGVLSGWTASGTRPTFDVVTGISTGGLIATYAFLGPEYDAELARLFLSVSDRDIYRKRGPIAALRSDSFATSDPLRRLIEAEITPTILQKVAQAHAQGRRLFVGTTNLDSRRLVIWDLGALAARGDLRLFRDVVLASASIPGFLPPVEIPVQVNGRCYSELHVDGGVSTQVFVRAFMLRLDRADGPTGGTVSPGSKIWVISDGKIYLDPACVKARTLDISGSAVSALLYAQTRNDLIRIYTLALLAGAEFCLTAVPQDFPVDPSSMQFEPATMRKLFDVGYRLGSSGRAGWRITPPGMEEAEQNLPRTGTRFTVPDGCRPAGPTNPETNSGPRPP